eukprot:TCALIF_06585-PA protein Name:"Similar to ANO7 Anoctamin-7 (Homo sapiens)" AED:0.52 eAED:0.52 QI:0/0/0/0.5/0/0.5/2/0/73
MKHIVFGVCRLIDLVVPDIPESLDIKIKRERFLAKEALQEAEHVLQVLKCYYKKRDSISITHSNKFLPPLSLV